MSCRVRIWGIWNRSLFHETVELFPQEKYKEGQKQEYLAREQERDEDTREYYTDKRRLWLQAYPSDKRSLIEFKDEMLMGLYNAELKKLFLFCMPKELQHENEIKAVLDCQLAIPWYKWVKGTYAHNFETEENRKRSDEIKKKGKIPMEVNTMKGIIV